MQTLETIKSKSQETVNNLLEKGKEQPEEVKTWGVTAGGAVVGAVAVAAVAKGVLALLATLASPPVALTIGAIGGGVLSWNYISGQSQPGQSEEAAPTAETATEAVEPVIPASAPSMEAAAI